MFNHCDHMLSFSVHQTVLHLTLSLGAVPAVTKLLKQPHFIINDKYLTFLLVFKIIFHCLHCVFNSLVVQLPWPETLNCVTASVCLCILCLLFENVSVFAYIASVVFYSTYKVYRNKNIDVALQINRRGCWINLQCCEKSLW